VGRYCLSNVTYTRRFATQRLFCGEEAELWIELINAKPLPLPWLKAEDEFPKEMPAQQAKLDYSAKAQRVVLSNVFSLRWYERVRRRYRLLAERRGVYDFGPVLISSGDLFGFRERWREDGAVDIVLVYPKIVPLEKLGLRAARPFGDLTTERRVVEDPLRLAAVRDYQAGDSIRYIHWKATARRGALQTKVFDPGASQTLIVALNTQTMAEAYSGVLSTCMKPVTVAASIAYAGLQTHWPVGLYANAGVRDSHRWSQCESGAAAISNRILESLAQLNYLTLIPFDRLLREEVSRFPYGATLVLVSPIMNAAIHSAILDLRAAGHPIALVMIGSLANRRRLTCQRISSLRTGRRWNGLSSDPKASHLPDFRFRLSKEQLVTAILAVLMTIIAVAWLEPWVMWATRNADPARTAPVVSPPLMLAIVFVGALVTRRAAMHSATWRQMAGRVVLGSIIVMAMAEVLALGVRPPLEFVKGLLTWNGFFSPEVVVLITAAILWLRGILIGRADVMREDIEGMFYTGVFALVVLLLFDAVRPAVPFGDLFWSALIFFVVSLLALALVGPEHAHFWHRETSMVRLVLNRYWLITIALMISLIVVVG
jgi:uncharacterized protein (DUF58 family)